MLEIGILGKKFIVDYITLFLGGLITISIIIGIISVIGPYIISILPEWVKLIFKGIVSIITLVILGRIFYYYKVQEGLGVLLSIGLTFFNVLCFWGVLGLLESVFSYKPTKMKNKLACAFCKNTTCEYTGLASVFLSFGTKFTTISIKSMATH